MINSEFIKNQHCINTYSLELISVRLKDTAIIVTNMMKQAFAFFRNYTEIISVIKMKRRAYANKQTHVSVIIPADGSGNDTRTVKCFGKRIEITS